MEVILQGFSDALTPTNLLYALVGVTLGTIIGLLPGLGSATGVALLLPLTSGIDVLSALILLAGIYYGSQYGASITAILIGTPGDPGSMMTTLDGYPLARQGRAGPALAVAAISSFAAGTLTIVLLMIAIPTVGRAALSFGPPENFALMVFGLVSLGAMTGENAVKGMSMAALGVLVATVGIDPQTGLARFTFGFGYLLGGVPFVPVVIGAFAVAEVLRQVSLGGALPIRTRLREMLPTREDLRLIRGPVARQSVLGFVIGALPGAGATIAAFFGYDMERRISKHGKDFGRGRVEGVAAAEAANNAAVNGAFLPTLTLGIPGSATTAVLLGAFLVQGLTPGPTFIAEEPRLVWGLLASFYLGNVMLLVLNLPLAPAFASLLRIPYSYMYPAILVVAFSGAYAIANNVQDMWLALVAGALGLVLRRWGYPMAPLILGIILGGLMETALGQTSGMGAGDLTILFTRPISAVLLVGALGFLVVPPLVRRRRRASVKAGADGEHVAS